MADLRVSSMRPGHGVNEEVSEKPLRYTAMLGDLHAPIGSQPKLLHLLLTASDHLSSVLYSFSLKMEGACSVEPQGHGLEA
jgi:hypothetical protein